MGLESGGGLEPLDYRAVCLLSLRYVAPYASGHLRAEALTVYAQYDVKYDSRTSQPAWQAGRVSILPALGPPLDRKNLLLYK